MFIFVTHRIIRVFLKRSHTCCINAVSISNVSLCASVWFLLLPPGDGGPAAGSERLQLHTGVQGRGHRQGQRGDDDLLPHQRTLEQLTSAEPGGGAGTADASVPARLTSFLQAAGVTAGTAGTRFAPRRGPAFPRSALETKDVRSACKDRFHLRDEGSKANLGLRRSLTLQEDVSSALAFLPFSSSLSVKRPAEWETSLIST